MLLRNLTYYHFTDYINGKSVRAVASDHDRINKLSICIQCKHMSILFRKIVKVP